MNEYKGSADLSWNVVGCNLQDFQVCQSGKCAILECSDFIVLQEPEREFASDILGKTSRACFALYVSSMNLLFVLTDVSSLLSR